jgi:hypothetical protein
MVILFQQAHWGIPFGASHRLPRIIPNPPIPVRYGPSIPVLTQNFIPEMHSIFSKHPIPFFDSSRVNGLYLRIVDGNLVGALDHFLNMFPFSWEFHHPN